MLNKINNGAIKTMQTILYISGGFATLTIIAGAFMRYIFKMDILGLDELTMLGAFWFYFIGSSYASWEDSHINAELISAFVKNPKILKVVAIIKYVLSIIICLITTYWCFEYIIWNIQMMPKSTVHKIPLLTTQIPILISFVMMTIYLVMHLLLAIKKDYGMEGEEK